MQRLSGKSRAGHIDSNVRHSAPKSNALEIPSRRSGEVTTGRLERRGCGQRPSSGTTFRTTAARCSAGRSISHTNVSEEFSARTDLERRPTQHSATLKARHGGIVDILTDTLTLRSTPLSRLADGIPWSFPPTRRQMFASTPDVRQWIERCCLILPFMHTVEQASRTVISSSAN
jgi:hypothetical protein